MTIEKVCLFKPGDIDAVQLKCAHCGSATSIPVAKLVGSNIGVTISMDCPQCRTASGFGIGNELESMVNFATVLGRLTDILQGKNIQLAFQVKCPEE
jgi:hypothetical protein